MKTDQNQNQMKLISVYYEEWVATLHMKLFIFFNDVQLVEMTSQNE